MMVLQSHVLFENSPESESMSCSNLVVNQQYKFKVRVDIVVHISIDC